MSAAEPRHPARHRVLSWTLCLLCSCPSLAGSLPLGFAGVEIGADWSTISQLHDFAELTASKLPLDQLASECGQRTLLARVGEGKLMVSLSNFVVTELSWTTPISPDSDLLAAADEVIAAYGEPVQASMRNGAGELTLSPTEARHISLHYEGTHRTVFSLSAASLWRQVIHIELDRRGWHENRSRRCVRQLLAAPDGTEKQSTPEG